jgi:hypothetical protein
LHMVCQHGWKLEKNDRAEFAKLRLFYHSLASARVSQNRLCWRIQSIYLHLQAAQNELNIRASGCTEVHFG